LLKQNRDEFITVAKNCSNTECGGFEIDDTYFGVHGFVEKGGGAPLAKPLFLAY